MKRFKKVAAFSRGQCCSMEICETTSRLYCTDWAVCVCMHGCHWDQTLSAQTDVDRDAHTHTRTPPRWHCFLLWFLRLSSRWNILLYCDACSRFLFTTLLVFFCLLNCSSLWPHAHTHCCTHHTHTRTHSLTKAKQERRSKTECECMWEWRGMIAMVCVSPLQHCMDQSNRPHTHTHACTRTHTHIDLPVFALSSEGTEQMGGNPKRGKQAAGVVEEMPNRQTRWNCGHLFVSVSSFRERCVQMW